MDEGSSADKVLWYLLDAQMQGKKIWCSGEKSQSKSIKLSISIFQDHKNCFTDWEIQQEAWERFSLPPKNYRL